MEKEYNPDRVGVTFFFFEKVGYPAKAPGYYAYTTPRICFRVLEDEKKSTVFVKMFDRKKRSNIQKNPEKVEH